MNPEGRSRRGAFRPREPKTLRVPPSGRGQAPDRDVGNVLEAWLSCQAGRGLKPQGRALVPWGGAWLSDGAWRGRALPGVVLRSPGGRDSAFLGAGIKLLGGAGIRLPGGAWRGVEGPGSPAGRAGLCSRAARAHWRRRRGGRQSPAWRCALASAAWARRGDAGAASSAGARPRPQRPTANRTRTPRRSSSRRARRRCPGRGTTGARAPRRPRDARCWSCRPSCWWRSSRRCPAPTCPAWPRSAPSSDAFCTLTPSGGGAAGRVSAPGRGLGPRGLDWEGLGWGPHQLWKGSCHRTRIPGGRSQPPGAAVTPGAAATDAGAGTGRGGVHGVLRDG